MPEGIFAADLRLDDGTTERFRASDSDEPSGEYEVVVSVEGRCTSAPTHAVFARWLVEDEASISVFEDSRRRLFGLRRDNIESFACDVLLRRRGAEPAEYVVIGLYGDEDGRGAARSHPAIVEWGAAHPSTSFSAIDTTGMKLATVVALHRTELMR